LTFIIDGGEKPHGSGEKKGGKRHIPVDGAGVPLTLVVTGANRHAVSQPEAILDALHIERPDIFDQPRHPCPDAGYTGEGALEVVVLRGFIPHIKSRGEEQSGKKNNRVVEVCHFRINCFRKPLVRFEKPASSYKGLLFFVCAFIAFRKANII
jgi:hypothetical protein